MRLRDWRWSMDEQLLGLKSQFNAENQGNFFLEAWIFFGNRMISPNYPGMCGLSFISATTWLMFGLSITVDATTHAKAWFPCKIGVVKSSCDLGLINNALKNSCWVHLEATLKCYLACLEFSLIFLGEKMKISNRRWGQGL